MAARVAEALHYAHTQGVIHRDVKPANILLDHEGRPHLTDFGLARREAGEVTLTLDGEPLGTPAYMPPEQARGKAHRVDGRGDLYSLGVVLYQLLTGELPFRGDAVMIQKQVLEEDPPPPRRLNIRIPRDLETICLKCLEKEPARRYALGRGAGRGPAAFPGWRRRSSPVRSAGSSGWGAGLAAIRGRRRSWWRWCWG